MSSPNSLAAVDSEICSTIAILICGFDDLIKFDGREIIGGRVLNLYLADSEHRIVINPFTALAEVKEASESALFLALG